MAADVFFQDWGGLLRIFVVGLLSYVTLVVVLRVMGKRVLSKLNAYDLVVTIALGSTLSAIILNKSIPLLEGVAALVLLVGLQWLVSWTTVRRPSFRKLISAEPALLLADGQVRADTMRRERIVESEVLQAVRDSGGRELADAEAVILQSDGSLAVILTGR